MAIKVKNVLVTHTDFDTSWANIKDNFTSWDDVKNSCSDWNNVFNCGINSTLEVTVGTPIKVTVSAVDVDWNVIKNDFDSWNDIKTNCTNWKAILNYH